MKQSTCAPVGMSRKGNCWEVAALVQQPNRTGLPYPKARTVELRKVQDKRCRKYGIIDVLLFITADVRIRH